MRAVDGTAISRDRCCHPPPTGLVFRRLARLWGVIRDLCRKPQIRGNLPAMPTTAHFRSTPQTWNIRLQLRQGNRYPILTSLNGTYVDAPHSHVNGGGPGINEKVSPDLFARYGMPQVRQTASLRLSTAFSITLTVVPQPAHSKSIFMDSIEEKSLLTSGPRSASVF